MLVGICRVGLGRTDFSGVRLNICSSRVRMNAVFSSVGLITSSFVL